jgi:hypothetical protein
MSGTLMGMTGMGANGAGLGAMSSLPPGLLQMLLAHAQGGAAGGMPAPQGPQLPGAMAQRPMMPNQAGQMPQPMPPQQAPGMASAMGGGGLQALLAALKGQQSGVTPQPGAGVSAFGAGGVLPPWLQAMLGGGAPMPTGQPTQNGMMSGSV